jgi:hypothetical protein
MPGLKLPVCCEPKPLQASASHHALEAAVYFGDRQGANLLQLGARVEDDILLIGTGRPELEACVASAKPFNNVCQRLGNGHAMQVTSLRQSEPRCMHSIPQQRLASWHPEVSHQLSKRQGRPHAANHAIICHHDDAVCSLVII